MTPTGAAALMADCSEVLALEVTSLKVMMSNGCAHPDLLSACISFSTRMMAAELPLNAQMFQWPTRIWADADAVKPQTTARRAIRRVGRMWSESTPDAANSKKDAVGLVKRHGHSRVYLSPRAIPGRRAGLSDLTRRPP